MGEQFFFFVKFVQTAAGSAEPEDTWWVFMYYPDIITAQTVGIIGVGFIGGIYLLQQQ